MHRPAHVGPLLAHKRRAQVMLYRAAILELPTPIPAYVGEISRHPRDWLRREILGLHRLVDQHGGAAVRAAVVTAQQLGAYGVEYVERLLAHAVPAAETHRPVLDLPSVPS